MHTLVCDESLCRSTVWSRRLLYALSELRVIAERLVVANSDYRFCDCFFVGNFSFSEIDLNFYRSRTSCWITSVWISSIKVYADSFDGIRKFHHNLRKFFFKITHHTKFSVSANLQLQMMLTAQSKLSMKHLKRLTNSVLTLVLTRTVWKRLLLVLTSVLKISRLQNHASVIQTWLQKWLSSQRNRFFHSSANQSSID